MSKQIALISLAVVTAVTGIILVKNQDGFLGISLAQESDSLLDGATTDSDGDGLPDAEEVKYGTNPYLLDTDNDGYTDKEEIDTGHDPLRAENDDQLDIDGDGLTGKDEAEFGTNPHAADSDYDGVPDGVEIVQGTNPLDASIGSLPDYIGANVAETRDPSLFPAVHPDEFKEIEEISNAASLDELTSGISPILGVYGPVDTGKGTPSLNIVSEQKPSMNVSERSDQAFIQAYFNTVGLLLATHSPALDVNQLEEFARTQNIRSPEARADLTRRFNNAYADFVALEVPNDQEIIELHAQVLGELHTARGIVQEIEQLNLESFSSIERLNTLVSESNQIIKNLQNNIVPMVEAVAVKHQYDLPASLYSYIN